MNESEKQLQDFLEFKFHGGYETWLKLSPQGDETTISKSQINLCTVSVKENQYSFGGISERFFNEMYQVFDPRA